MPSIASSWLPALLLCISLLSAAGAEDPGVHASSADLKKELAQVIQGQLAAFRAGDFAKAYTFASSEIQSVFSAEAFEEMVKASYPVIAHSSSAEIDETMDNGEDALVDVRVVSVTEKRAGQFRYRLRLQDGKWRITGVLEIKPPGIAV